jgi:NADPH:quinone reductase
MATPSDRTGLQLHSLVKPSGELEVSLASVPIPSPGPDEVLVRIDASPINPSDLGLLFPGIDPSRGQVTGSSERPVFRARIPDAAMRALAGRVGAAMPVGNEGAGVVVEAGSSPAAQALAGKTVAVLGGGMYSQVRCLAASQCLLLPDGATAADGASAFINPLTALGMCETMRREGHTALVHTAAASNLGQMLNRICRKDGIGLVNIVRKPEQAALLRAQGAVHVCDTSAETFAADLIAALDATGATIAFDAIGGGRLAGQILDGMETVLGAKAKSYSRYGSSTHKQVYVYGMLDPGPTELARTYGMAWGIGGWLLTPFLQKVGPATAQALKQRVAAEIKTTFATRYGRTISLADVLKLDSIAVYARRATGEKFLVDPNQGLR